MGGAHFPPCMFGGQRVTCVSLSFPPTTMRVLEIDLRLGSECLQPLSRLASPQPLLRLLSGLHPSEMSVSIDAVPALTLTQSERRVLFS